MSYQYIKYPRTFHLPWSPGATSDDKVLPSVKHLNGQDVVVTEKLDGENTTLYRDHLHARSIESGHHPSRTQVKRIHAQLAQDIPEGWRICGENMQAMHSIPYQDLAGYFYVFSIWDSENHCLSWDETVEWANLLELPIVPVLYRGAFEEDAVRRLTLDLERQEGYVVRAASRFHYSAFNTQVAKWVRPNHVQTDQHWRHVQMVENSLKSGGERG